MLNSSRVAAVQTLSGTGACRLFGEFINRFVGTGVDMYMPNPTWGNHIPIMKDAGLVPSQYRYYDPNTCGVDFEGMKQDITVLMTGQCSCCMHVLTTPQDAIPHKLNGMNYPNHESEESHRIL